MRKFTYILIAVQIVLISCNQVDNDLAKWNKIKNEKDFSAFFRFALTVQDSLLLYQCVDSLENNKPLSSCFVLANYDYYDETTDSVNLVNYYLYDNSEYHRDYKDRNIVFINIDSLSKVQIKYSYSNYLEYFNLLQTLFDTTSSSYDLPEYIVTNFQGKEYKVRKLATYIQANHRNCL